ncbi:MAG: TetR family transcriptional regulator [Burkholderiales bacterium PBB3]|nr:MAG: TetR family transcriptional regulator [Burkholderiales bacterium PBB3]
MPSPINFCEIAATVRAKRERRKDARPGELLDAALELFVEKGFAATRAEEVAKRAGVSKGTLFLYFSSKEELFKAVVRENLSGQFTEWNAMFDCFPGTTPEMLKFCMHSWWERIGSTKASGITKLMMSEAGNFPELAEFYKAEVIRPGNLLIQRLIQRGIDRGEFRPIDAQKAVYVVLAPLLFLALWTHSFGSLDDACDQLRPDEFLATQLDTLLNGLCVPGAKPAPGVAAQGIMAASR